MNPTVLLVVDDEWLRPGLDGEMPDPVALERMHRLAREMATDGLVTTRVVPLANLPHDPDGFRHDTILLVHDELDAAAALAARLGTSVESVGRRTFAVEANRRRDAVATLERTRGPGCVERYRLFVWQTELPEDDPPGGVFGRKDVAAAIGAHWESPALWESEHYAMLAHDAYPTLPRLLGRYLAGFVDA